MRIHELLVEGYKEAETEFGQSATADVVKKSIAAYRLLVDRNQVQGNERNIDWWRKQGWLKFQDFVNSKSKQPSATQVKRKRVAGNSITIHETDKWLIVMPLDHDASCFHGRDTDWCTARPTGDHFDSYFLDQKVNLIYLLNKETGTKYAVASYPQADEVKLFDQKDDEMTVAQFKSATGYTPQQVIALIPVNDPRIAHARTTRQELLAVLQQRMTAWSQGDRSRAAELEQLLSTAKHAPSCNNYITTVGMSHGPQVFPEIIALAATRLSPAAIQYIKDPSRVVQLVAVQRRGSTIQYIKNPSPEVQLAAVQNAGHAIGYINNPSLQLQMAAVRKDGEAIQYIKNPSPEVVELASSQGFDQQGRRI